MNPPNLSLSGLGRNAASSIFPTSSERLSKLCGLSISIFIFSPASFRARRPHLARIVFTFHIKYDMFELGYEAVGELDSRLEPFSDWKQPNNAGPKTSKDA